MQTENEKITYTFHELKDVLVEIELILQSLHRMGAYYGDKFSTCSEEIYREEYEKETTRFIDEWHICGRLAKVRCILSEKFDKTLREDNISDLERAMERVRHWNKPGDKP